MPDKKDRIELREITADTVWPIFKLQVTENQGQFVAPNAHSIAEAYFTKEAWFRGIYLGDTPVGFMMLYADQAKPEYFLWRLMIDQEHQGLGYGTQAMSLVIEHVKSLPGADELLVSYVPGEGNPAPFYYRLGFVETGRWEDNEKVLSLKLD